MAIVGRRSRRVGSQVRAETQKAAEKESKNVGTILGEILDQKLAFQERGVNRKITIREGILRGAVNKALKGDLKAIAFLLAREPEIARAQPVERNTDNMTAAELMKVYKELVG